MTLKLITDATVEPITLAQAKVQCRIDSDITTDDDLITGLITAARQQAEQELGRALITQTWERVLDAFPSAEIELGKPRVIAITSVTYIDGAGDSQTLSAADYSLDADTDGGFLLPAINTVWPTTLDTVNAVRVRFTAGFGAAADAVPGGIKAWILAKVAALHPNGDKVTPDQQAMLDRLLDPWRVWG